MFSNNNIYYFVNQKDGNLVIYEKKNNNNVPIWSWNTYNINNNLPYKLYMQPDANLVLYDTTWRVIWKSNTVKNNSVYSLLLTDLGKLNIIDNSSNNIIWST